jgi:rRNA maturation endonuclease Nob1
MSLINQALHKAQRDRTPNRMAQPTDSAQPAAAVPVSGNGMKPSLMIGLVIAVALLLGLVAGLSVVLLKDNSAPIQQVSESTPPTVAQVTPIAPPAITQRAPAAPIAPFEPARPLAQETIEEQVGPTVIEELRLARQAAEAKAEAEAIAAQEAEAKRIAAEEEAARKAAAKPSQDIINWLGQAKVSGVRLSETGSKVILNGKAYAVGETVHYGLGLKVLIVQEKRILFIDTNGKKYMKTL